MDLASQRRIDKVDLLFMIDNSASMSDKQQMLKLAVPQLLGRLLNPLCRNEAGATAASTDGICPAGFELEYQPVDDIHIAVISSSLGSPGADACAEGTVDYGNDGGHLIGLRRTKPDGSPLETYQGLGFLAWDPKGKKAAQGLPPGESDPARLIQNFQDLVVATDETGCGYEASLEAWYRFLIDPAPPASWVVEGDVARPEGLDTALLEERRQFLRPDSLVAVVMLSDENDCSLDFSGDGWLLGYNGKNGDNWSMPRATSACGSDVNSPCCRPCVAEPSGPPTGCTAIESDPVCSQGMRHDSQGDPRNLRCFDQRRRFGLTRLYPVARYIEGLTSPTLQQNGVSVLNPLYTDLNTGLVASRTPDLVFLAGIVGVPWQDIAVAESLGPAAEGSLRYQDAASLKKNDVWSLIVGDPGTATPPTDPLMRESREPRQGTTPGQSPLAPPEAAFLANPINGHEYYTPTSGDLQYACVFPLEPAVPCDGPGCECEKSSETLSPLCQGSDSQYGDTQVYAKAYPGLRQLEVLAGVGESGIVASICPKLLPSADATATLDPNVGYNPAVESILESIGSKLGGKCVPRKLSPDPTTGSVPCAMVEVLASGGAACEPCSAVPGRREVTPKVASAVHKELVANGRCQKPPCPDTCLCEIEQPQGDALTACQNDPAASSPGYCYIDAELPRTNPALVQGCPGQRGLRFVGEETPRNGAQTFIACIGAPFGDSE